MENDITTDTELSIMGQLLGANTQEEVALVAAKLQVLDARKGS